MYLFLKLLLSDHLISVTHNPVLNLHRVNTLGFIAHTLRICILLLLLLALFVHGSYLLLLTIREYLLFLVLTLKSLDFLIFLQVCLALLHQLLCAISLPLSVALTLLLELARSCDLTRFHKVDLALKSLHLLL